MVVLVVVIVVVAVAIIERDSRNPKLDDGDKHQAKSAAELNVLPTVSASQHQNNAKFKADDPKVVKSRNRAGKPFSSTDGWNPQKCKGIFSVD